MRQSYTPSFKEQAVAKVFGRSDDTEIKDVALSLGIGYSTLKSWMFQARKQEFDNTSTIAGNSVTNEKRPQDWTLEERLQAVVACSSLDDESLNEYCRSKGIYPHHVNQWKLDFVSDRGQNNRLVAPSELKTLKKLNSENKALKKELNRKDKALAETAALLVLQKKVAEIWGSDEDEDNSQ